MYNAILYSNLISLEHGWKIS